MIGPERNNYESSRGNWARAVHVFHPKRRERRAEKVAAGGIERGRAGKTKREKSDLADAMSPLSSVQKFGPLVLSSPCIKQASSPVGAFKPEIGRPQVCQFDVGIWQVDIVIAEDLCH